MASATSRFPDTNIITLTVILLISFAFLAANGKDDHRDFILATCSKTSNSTFCLEIIEPFSSSLPTIYHVQIFTLKAGTVKSLFYGRTFYELLEDRRNVPVPRIRCFSTCKNLYNDAARLYDRARDAYTAKNMDGAKEELHGVLRNISACEQELDRNNIRDEKSDYQKRLAELNLDLMNIQNPAVQQ